MNILEVRNLCLTLDGQIIFHDLSFDIRSGEFLALLGPNGGGKTSLVKAILGLQEKRTLTGDIRSMVDQSKIAYIPQRLESDTKLPLTVEELFLMETPSRFFFRGSKQNIRKRLEPFGVGHVIEQNFYSLSGGQKQRVLLAFSLLRSPSLLILDEPLSGVDIEGEKTFLELLLSLKTHGTAILLVSHDVDMVSASVDRVICLNKKILCQGVPQKTLTRDFVDELYRGSMQHYHHSHL